MKYLITMNMPSSQGFLIHQIIFEHHDDEMSIFVNRLNEEIFVYGQQFYKRQNENGESFFVDKGEIIINTAHIGKVQKYIDYDAEEFSRQPPRQRPPVRASRNGY